MKTENTLYRSTIGVVLAAAAILLVPLLAMQVTDQVVWDPMDFAVAGALIIGVGLMYQSAARQAGGIAYRAAAGVALAAGFLLIWINLAVGIIGDEGHPANLMYAGVLAVGIVGSIIARARPGGMARAMVATACAQALVAGIAVVAGLGAPASGALELLGLNGMFIAMWVASASLFRGAGRAEP